MRTLSMVLALAAMASCGNVDNTPVSSGAAKTTNALTTEVGIPVGPPTRFMTDSDFRARIAQRKVYVQQHPEMLKESAVAGLAGTEVSR